MCLVEEIVGLSSVPRTHLDMDLWNIKLLAGTVSLACDVEVRQTTLNLVDSLPNTHCDIEWLLGSSEQAQANDDANHRCMRSLKRLVR